LDADNDDDAIGLSSESVVAGLHILALKNSSGPHAIQVVQLKDDKRGPFLFIFRMEAFLFTYDAVVHGFYLHQSVQLQQSTVAGEDIKNSWRRHQEQ
jgi:hypothetical protein